MTTLEAILLIVLVLVPYSIYRQMQVAEIDTGGLIKLPLIFILVGVLGFGIHSDDLPHDAGEGVYLAASVLIAVGFGVWRGYRMDIWRDESVASGWKQQGNRTTLILWIALILSKVVLGTIAGFAGIDAGTHTGDIFVFIGISFAIQNVVVAQRSLWRDAPPGEAVQARAGEVQDQMRSQKPEDARTE